MAVPSLGLTGRFTLLEPFYRAKPEVIYTVIALRDFTDIYSSGRDVYKDYYEKMGLTNGVLVNGVSFDFKTETDKKPIIVTLAGSDGTQIHVPSTFILSFPQMTDVKYSRLVLSIDLGALPDYVPVESILADIKDIVNTRFGVKSEVLINRAPVLSQPTAQEHEVLEASRIGSIRVATNNYFELLKAKSTIDALQVKLKAMTKVLRDNKLI